MAAGLPTVPGASLDQMRGQMQALMEGQVKADQVRGGGADLGGVGGWSSQTRCALGGGGLVSQTRCAWGGGSLTGLFLKGSAT